VTVFETERLLLRRFTLDDAAFILELVNEPAWIRYIGDRNIRTLDDARAYLQTGPLDMYERCGFGLYLIERKQDATAIGTCGLVKRDTLEFADIGFALLERYTEQGYAMEAAAATRAHARALGLPRLLAITTHDNRASQKLLGKLGMQLEREIQIPGDPEPLCLFALNLSCEDGHDARRS
jgi:RimJ/RimL family protein N-acetyltransferase